MRKGSPILIEGRLRLDSWEDKQTGQKRNKLTVIGEVVQFLGGNRGAEAGAAPSAPTARPSAPAPAHSEPAPPAPDADGAGPEEDDVPF